MSVGVMAKDPVTRGAEKIEEMGTFGRRIYEPVTCSLAFHDVQ